MSEPVGYVEPNYLDVTAELLRQAKQHSYAALHLEPGHRVLDVGCGPGTDTIPLAQWVAPGGQVVGVDQDAVMLNLAEQNAARAGVSDHVKHLRGDALALPFAPDCFDACRSERLFLHLLEPDRALAEMIRVTRPGGWIVALDTDHGSMSINTPEVDIERRLIRVLAERCLNNGYSGRQLYQRFAQQRLADIAIELFPFYVTHYALARQVARLDRVEEEALACGIVTPEELARWRASLEQADAQGAFFGCSTLIMVAGRKRL